MWHIRNRRVLISAVAGVLLWLVAVLAVLAWRHPQFWLGPGERFARAQTLAAEQQWAGSLAEVDQALDRDPDNAGYLTFRGYRQLDLGNAGAAEASFRRALAREPAEVEARLGLATALERGGQPEQSLRVLGSIPPDAMTDAQLRRRQRQHAALGARDLALADAALLLHAHPDDRELLEEAAGHALALEDWSRAASFAERLRAAATDPAQQKRAADIRAVALEALGRIEDAYASHTEADNPDRLETRAYLAMTLGRSGEAAALYGSLAAAHPNESRFARNHALALRAAGRLEEAIRVYEGLIAGPSADPADRRSLAWLLNLQRRYAEAWRVVEPLPRPAREPELLELQTRTALWAGQRDEAVQLLRALLRVRPADAELWRRLADVHLALGELRDSADALQAYLRIESRDLAARRELAGLLARAGSLDEAMRQHEILAAAEPASPDAHRALALLYETRGDLDRALAASLRAAALTREPDADLRLRLARLSRWTGAHEAAIEWYERYLETSGDGVLRRQAETELALSLLQADAAPQSLARLQALEADGPLDAGALLTAARAATASGEPVLAARFLERLAQDRALDTAERSWLAGMYRAAGEPRRALALYEQLQETASPPMAVLEAVADLRYDSGDYRGAIVALRRLPEERTARKLARAAARAGDLDLAAAAYARQTRDHPDDLDGRLEAARYLASAGRPAEALAHYRVVVERRSADGLRIELARASLAAGRFAEAEPWARQALAAGEDAAQASLALAQSLHWQGRHGEAEPILAALLRDEPRQAEGLVWRGRVAVARDRHLAAYRAFDAAIAAGADRPGELHLELATAASRRGDHGRAEAHRRQAAAAGAGAPEVSAVDRELDEAAAPLLLVPGWLHGDTNDLRMSQVGGGVLLFLPSKAGALSLEGYAGSIAQRGFSTATATVLAGLSGLFPTPAIELRLGAGFNQYDRGRDLLTWRANATYHFADGGAVGVLAVREPMLPMDARPELRQFNRVLDVGAIGPGFHVQRVQAVADLLAGQQGRALVEAGGERAADGNSRLFAYLHYQLPLASAANRWTAIRPNLFLERYRERRRFYFSPASHFTLGTMLHSIQRSARWQMELELNPQLLRTDGVNGFGGHGLFSVAAKIRGVTVGAGTFVFFDGLEDYLQWRVDGRIHVPIGR